MQASSDPGRHHSAPPADPGGGFDEPITGRRLRDAMACFATGVAVVSCRTDSGPCGITANSIQSVSLDPPLVSFAVSRNAWSLPAFAQAGSYAISVLTAEQEPLAMRFASRGADKWRDVAFDSGHQGAPLLPGALATFECVPYAVLDAGDHQLFLGRVLRVTTAGDGQPLLFFRGRFDRRAAE
jgi:flavin reductase (DIM6/NTAB) family NADH-FMN oxidoreductase RutF